MTKINTEYWDGKPVQVIRDSRGDIITHNGNMTIDEAKNKFKRDNTLEDGEHHEKLSHVTVIYQDVDSGYKPQDVSPIFETNESKKFKPENNRGYDSYMYYVKGKMRNKKIIIASSRKHSKKYPTDKARSEAYSNFWSKVSASYHGVSGQEIDQKVVKYVSSIKEGFIYFKANQQVRG